MFLLLPLLPLLLFFSSVLSSASSSASFFVFFFRLFFWDWFFVVLALKPVEFSSKKGSMPKLALPPVTFFCENHEKCQILALFAANFRHFLRFSLKAVTGGSANFGIDPFFDEKTTDLRAKTTTKMATASS